MRLERVIRASYPPGSRERPSHPIYSDPELALHAWALAHGLASLWLSGGAEQVLSLEAWRELSRRALGRMWAGLLLGPATPGR